MVMDYIRQIYIYTSYLKNRKAQFGARGWIRTTEPVVYKTTALPLSYTRMVTINIQLSIINKINYILFFVESCMLIYSISFFTIQAIIRSKYNRRPIIIGRLYF